MSAALSDEEECDYITSEPITVLQFPLCRIGGNSGDRRGKYVDLKHLLYNYRLRRRDPLTNERLNWNLYEAVNLNRDVHHNFNYDYRNTVFYLEQCRKGFSEYVVLDNNNDVNEYPLVVGPLLIANNERFIRFRNEMMSAIQNADFRNPDLFAFETFVIGYWMNHPFSEFDRLLGIFNGMPFVYRKDHIDNDERMESLVNFRLNMKGDIIRSILSDEMIDEYWKAHPYDPNTTVDNEVRIILNGYHDGIF